MAGIGILASSYSHQILPRSRAMKKHNLYTRKHLAQQQLHTHFSKPFQMALCTFLMLILFFWALCQLKSCLSQYDQSNSFYFSQLSLSAFCFSVSTNSFCITLAVVIAFKQHLIFTYDDLYCLRSGFLQLLFSTLGQLSHSHNVLHAHQRVFCCLAAHFQLLKFSHFYTLWDPGIRSLKAALERAPTNKQKRIAG